MILSYAYDVEVLPNFFSITIISVNSYLKTFAECIDTNNKNKPIPLTKKYSVEAIKTLLDSVDKRSFYITDKDDSQLFSMLSFINAMRSHYNKNNVAVRYDMFGYNSSRYDKQMVAGLLMFANQCNTTKELINKLYELSKAIISSQNDYKAYKKNYLLSSVNKYQLPYTNIDVMSIFALNKIGRHIDANGNVCFFGKSLKQTSINLQWYELLEYELPPISDADIHLYKRNPLYKGKSIEELNILIDKWDRYIIPEWIPPMMHYNENDVFIVCEIIRLFIDEIRLRYNISKIYNIDVLNSSRSNIADKMFIKFYSEFSGLDESEWRGYKTERSSLSFKDVIFPFISFKTEALQELLSEMKNVTITSLGKDSFLKEIKIGKLIYTIATGGLHTQDIPRELRSKIINLPTSTGDSPVKNIWENITDDSYIYIHTDVSSFYPSIMDIYKIYPAHLDETAFVKLIHWLKETRVTAKHSKENLINGIPKDVLAQVLKIVINSLYGKLGYEQGDICDKLAVLKVTINGQLMLIMLCEELELNGIEVISANTDGIVIKLYKNNLDKYKVVLQNWLNITKLTVDSEEYKCYINRDINNYVVEELNGKISYKGALNPYMHLVDLQKGYNAPIVAQAVVNYFLYDKPILDTFREATNILDFCKTQNVGNQFHVEYGIGASCITMQRNVRYYVSTIGGILEKVHNVSKARNGLCAGNQVIVLNTLDDMPIEYRNINYSYYYNEALKIIDPIKLGISPTARANRSKGILSGKNIIKKNSMYYNTLFDDLEEEQ